MTSGETVSEQSCVRTGSALQTLELSGRLTFGPESEKWYGEMRSHIEQGCPNFVFDLRGVPDMDSAGIGFLVTCLTTVLRAGGRLYLAAPSNRVLYSLLITKLDTVFPIFENVDAAAADLREQRNPSAPPWLLRAG